MTKYIQIGVAVLTVLTLTLLKHWHEPFHLAIGGMTLGLSVLAVFLWRKSRQEEEGETAVAEEVEEGPLRPVVFGLLGGAFVCLLLGLMFGVVQEIDLVARLFEGQQRKKFETQLRPLIDTGQHTQAIRLMQDRLRQRASATWRTNLLDQLYSQLVEAAHDATSVEQCTNLLVSAKSLANSNRFDARLAEERLGIAIQCEVARVQFERLRTARRWVELVPALQFAMGAKPRARWEMLYDRSLYDAYIGWAKDCKDLPTKKEKLQLAQKVAQEFHLDGSTALAMLETVDQGAANAAQVKMAEDRTKAKSQAEIDVLNARLTQAEAQRKREEEQARLDLQRAEFQAKFDGLLTAGDAFKDPEPQRTLERRRELYNQALDFAQANGLDPQPARMRLNRTTHELTDFLAQLERESRPIDLPSGARISLCRLLTDSFPPSLGLELAVENAQGEPIPLSIKDFLFTVGDQKPNHVALASMQNEPPPLYLALLIDSSGSMEGPAMSAAILGAQEMLASLSSSESQIHIKVIWFSDHLRSIEWTSNMRQASAAISEITAGGQTALYVAVSTALEELKACIGEKAIILFSDGADNKPPRNFDPKSLPARLRDARIRTFTIGLKTRDLDVRTLERLASETGGAYLMAAAPNQLAAQFLAARKKLRQPLYRFVLSHSFEPASDSFPLKIKIGSANALEKLFLVERKSKLASATK